MWKSKLRMRGLRVSGIRTWCANHRASVPRGLKVRNCWDRLLRFTHELYGALQHVVPLSICSLYIFPALSVVSDSATPTAVQSQTPVEREHVRTIAEHCNFLANNVEQMQLNKSIYWLVSDVDSRSKLNRSPDVCILRTDVWISLDDVMEWWGCDSSCLGYK